MLTAVLVLQVLLIVCFLVLSIVGWRKLTEKSIEKTEKLIEKTDVGWRKLTEKSIEKTEKLTEKTEKLTEKTEKLIEKTEKLTEKKVSVSYEHVIYHRDGLFKNVVVASSRVQFLYDGLPIGEPTEKIVYSSNKVDKEAVQAALTGALQTLQIAIDASGIPLTVLNKIEDVIKTLSK